MKALGLTPHRIGYRCPWQNGALERFNGTLRRELLDHVIVKDEAHLRRLLRDFVRYYHEDRTHLGLGKDTPNLRPDQARPGPQAIVVGEPRVGGLHHRYTWRDAA
jgi:transposase InsO family protein